VRFVTQFLKRLGNKGNKLPRPASFRGHLVWTLVEFNSANDSFNNGFLTQVALGGSLAATPFRENALPKVGLILSGAGRGASLERLAASQARQRL
jgi:hypothetical protein